MTIDVKPGRRIGAGKVVDRLEAADPQRLEEQLATLEPTFAIRVALPPDPRYFRPLRHHVRSHCGRAHGDRAAFRMELVLDELCTNAIEHGPPGAPVEVDLSYADGRIDYRVANRMEDPGATARQLRQLVAGFDATGSYLEERGRGLFLVVHLMDGMEIDGSGDRLVLHVWKDLGGPAG